MSNNLVRFSNKKKRMKTKSHTKKKRAYNYENKNIIGGAEAPPVDVSSLLNYINPQKQNLIRTETIIVGEYQTLVEKLPSHHICAIKEGEPTFEPGSHEHTIDCALNISIVSRIYHGYKTHKLRVIQSEFFLKYNINIQDLDYIQTQVFKLVLDDLKKRNDQTVIDDIALTPDNLLLHVDTEFTDIKIIQDFLLILELYQKCLDLFTVSKILQENSREINNFFQIKNDPKLSKSEKEFRLGVVPVDIDYIGTFYERNCTAFFSPDGTVTARFLNEKPRDCFTVPFKYQNLLGNENEKLALYASTGTSFNANQRNMLSPFNGFAVKYLNNYDNPVTNKLIVQIANAVNINREKTTRFLRKGKLNEKGTIATIESIKPENTYHSFLIKMSGTFAASKYKTSSGVEYLMIQQNYSKFSSRCRKKVVDFLGGDYLKEMMLHGDVIYKKSRKYPKRYFRFAKNPLEEVVENYGNVRDNIESVKVFEQRYFGNKQMYSFRNMAPTEIQNRKNIDELDTNKIIGTNNIFGKNFDDHEFIKKQFTPKYKLSAEIDKLILSYFIDCYCYLKHQEFNIMSLDLKEVIRLYQQEYSGEKEFVGGVFNLEFNTHREFVDLDELDRIIKILRFLAGKIKINEDVDKLRKFRKTNFYIMVKQPNYQEL